MCIYLLNYRFHAEEGKNRKLKIAFECRDKTIAAFIPVEGKCGTRKKRQRR